MLLQSPVLVQEHCKAELLLSELSNFKASCFAAAELVDGVFISVHITFKLL